jgi:hypothetical protein
MPWGQVPGSAGNAQMPGTCPLAGGLEGLDDAAAGAG